MNLLPLFIIILAIAFLTGSDSLFYLAYVLGGIGLVTFVWMQQALLGVQSRRRFSARAFHGEEVTVELDVTNQGRWPLLWLRVHESIPLSLHVPNFEHRVVSLAPGEKTTLHYQLNCQRRGYYHLGPLKLETGDLLQLTANKEVVFDAEPFIVYPRVVPLRQLGLPSQLPFGNLPSRQRIFEDPSRFFGVRDYVPGDSLRQINWKSSARAGQLQVKRFQPAIALHTVILLDLNDEAYSLRGRAAGGEMGIIVAASIAAHLIERRQQVGLALLGLRPGHRVYRTASDFPRARTRPLDAHVGSVGARRDGSDRAAYFGAASSQRGSGLGQHRRGHQPRRKPSSGGLAAANAATGLSRHVYRHRPPDPFPPSARRVGANRHPRLLGDPRARNGCVAMNQNENTTPKLDWAALLFRPLLISGMTTCIAASWVMLIEAVLGDWRGGYIVGLVALVTLETLIVERQTRIHGWFYSDRLRVRLTEIGVMLVVLKPASYLHRGWGALANDMRMLPYQPMSFFDGHFIMGVIVIVALWLLALNMAGSLAELESLGVRPHRPRDSQKRAKEVTFVRERSSCCCPSACRV